MYPIDLYLLCDLLDLLVVLYMPGMVFVVRTGCAISACAGLAVTLWPLVNILYTIHII